jgi:hypothetical protein
MAGNDSGEPMGHVVAYDGAHIAMRGLAAVLERTDYQICCRDGQHRHARVSDQIGGSASVLPDLPYRSA